MRVVSSPAVSVALLAGLLATVRAAPAAAAEPDAEAIRAAAAEFDLADRAYERKDFANAAVHFEGAFQRAPHPDALELAIRSRLKLDELPRAATLAALALPAYRDQPTLATLAASTLETAQAQLLDVTVQCAPACALAADGKILWQSDVTQFRFFLAPGKHSLSAGWSEGRARTTDMDAVAGRTGSFTFEAPPPRAPAPPLLVAGEGPVDAPSRSRGGRGLPPVVFFVGLGVTALGGLATGLSAVDAQANPGEAVVRERCRGLGTACPEYQDGKDAELRTNLLLGGTLVVGVATAVVGLAFTRWPGSGGAKSSMTQSANGATFRF